MKIQPPNREEIFANLILGKGLISRMYNTKDSQNSIVKKKHMQLENGKELWTHIAERDLQMENKYIKKCSTSLTLKEMQILSHNKILLYLILPE